MIYCRDCEKLFILPIRWKNQSHICINCRRLKLAIWRDKNPDKRVIYESKDKEKRREARWKRQYGITREMYNSTLSQQDGKCAICKTKEIGRGHTHFHVDHNHSTNKIRGLLCDKCNRGLGFFKDNYTILTAACEYLKFYEDKENN